MDHPVCLKDPLIYTMFNANYPINIFEYYPSINGHEGALTNPMELSGLREQFSEQSLEGQIYFKWTISYHAKILQISHFYFSMNLLY